jgi:hypothetical protein
LHHDAFLAVDTHHPDVRRRSTGDVVDGRDDASSFNERTEKAFSLWRGALASFTMDGKASRVQTECVADSMSGDMC